MPALFLGETGPFSSRSGYPGCRSDTKKIPTICSAFIIEKREGSLTKEIAGTPIKPIEEVKIWSNMPANQHRNGSQSGTQENWESTRGNLRATPYNNRFNLNGHGRHVLCLRKGRAGTQRRPSFPGRSPFAMYHQVNRALYGRNKGKCGTKSNVCERKL